MRIVVRTLTSGCTRVLIDKDFISIAENYVTVRYTGRVDWLFPAITTSACKIDVEFFPYDVQRCNLTFYPWTLDDQKMHFYAMADEDASQERYVQNGIWNLQDTRVNNISIKYPCCPSPNDHVVYTLTFRRESSFYTINIVVPSFFLIALMLVGFWLHPESGEKVTFAMSNLLALILFQQLVADNMPPIGEPRSILVTCFSVLIALSVCSVMLTVMVLHVYNHEAVSHPPKWSFQLLRIFVAREASSTMREFYGPNDDKSETATCDAPTANIDSREPTKMTCYKDLERVPPTSVKSEAVWSLTLVSIKETQRQELNRFLWRHMAHAFDMACGLSNAFSAEKVVAERLVANYGPRSARPVRDSSTTVTVYIRVLLSELIAFSWKDEYLQWDAKEFNGTVLLKPEDVWIPDVVLEESVDRNFISFPETYIIVNNDGNIDWYFPAIFTTTCKVDVRFFPFDVQECRLTFLPWSLDESSMVLRFPDGADANQNIYNRNGIWYPETFQATNESYKYLCCQYPYSKVIYTLKLQRESAFFRETIILPSVLLTLLMALVSWLHPASGEKMTLAVSNLLALILFQQLVADNMPPIGDSSSIIVTFFFIMIALGCASVIFSVVVLRVYHRGGDTALPGWACFIISRCAWCSSIFGRVRLQAAIKAMMSESPKVTFINSISRDIKQNANLSDRAEKQPSSPGAVKGKVVTTSDSSGAGGINQRSPKLDSGSLPFNEDLTVKERNAMMWREAALVLDKIFGLFQFLVICSAYLYMLIGYLQQGQTT
ncbi:uncharacterized protein [Diadema setosum]|uniref:uncharacterized protein n=1 Tax=Diadema setosum TaxID=31175 RepID=UPI003B3BAE3E